MKFIKKNGSIYELVHREFLVIGHFNDGDVKEAIGYTKSHATAIGMAMSKLLEIMSVYSQKDCAVELLPLQFDTGYESFEYISVKYKADGNSHITDTVYIYYLDTKIEMLDKGMHDALLKKGYSSYRRMIGLDEEDE